MPDITPFLKELISAPGLSGFEAPTARLIEEKWRPLVDEVSRSRVGSLHALKHGTADAPRPSIMVATHMDAIGLMVTNIVDGFLRVTAVGGVDARILPGMPVIVHAKEKDLPGVVVQPPGFALPDKIGSNPVPLTELLVDVGLLPKRVANLVCVGDLVSFATEPADLSGEALAGHSLDNRASVAAMTVALEELQSRSHAWDVLAVATVQEEVGLIGGYTSAFDLKPSLAVAVDVTFAKGPGASDWQTFPLGKGITLAWGPNIHPYIHKTFKELADKLEIPYAIEMTPRHSGTDAYAMQVAAEGIPTAVVSIPLRYMHTPVEVVGVKDVQRAGRLLAEFVASLDVDFIDKITWDE